MIDASAAYKEAIVGDARQTLIKAVVDIISPDIQYKDPRGDSQSFNSRPEQLHDKVFESDINIVTLERNRWIFGEDNVFASDVDPESEVGYEGDLLSSDDGTFPFSVWVEQPFAGVKILQSCSVWFKGSDIDGVAEDFTVDIMESGIVRHSIAVEGNKDSFASFFGFSVYYPDAIRVTVTKWSLPSRRLRVIEIYPGFYAEWDGGNISSISVKHQADVSCLTLPYGTCSLGIDNLSRLFEPRRKDGIFQSIEDRQPIDILFGVRLPDGSNEYKRAGIYYQSSGGWKTGDNNITMKWSLVDIVGLLAGREYIPPATLPTTLKGWVASLTAQLGENFQELYRVDPDYEDLPVTGASMSDVAGQKCGNILIWACQVTGTWPRADAETGYLAVEPLWDQGNSMTLDNMASYPVIKANTDLASIIFTLNDSDHTRLVIGGNNAASNETRSVKNPFIRTEAQAREVAKRVLSAFGGNKYEVTGRGNPSSEIGDVDTIWLDESNATTARRIMQKFSLSGGVMKNCVSHLLQADGSFLWENRVVITESGEWEAPEGAHTLRAILVGRGENGTRGTAGTWNSKGADGADGQGGRIWSGVINSNDRQIFPVTIEDNATFGPYSSANGQRYPTGYTDISSGDLYGAAGVKNPPAGSGHGGYRGLGGSQGRKHMINLFDEVIDAYPGDPIPPHTGASGCVVIYWSK